MDKNKEKEEEDFDYCCKMIYEYTEFYPLDLDMILKDFQNYKKQNLNNEFLMKVMDRYKADRKIDYNNSEKEFIKDKYDNPLFINPYIIFVFNLDIKVKENSKIVYNKCLIHYHSKEECYKATTPHAKEFLQQLYFHLYTNNGDFISHLKKIVTNNQISKDSKAKLFELYCVEMMKLKLKMNANFKLSVVKSEKASNYTGTITINKPQITTFLKVNNWNSIQNAVNNAFKNKKTCTIFMQPEGTQFTLIDLYIFELNFHDHYAVHHLFNVSYNIQNHQNKFDLILSAVEGDNILKNLKITQKDDPKLIRSARDIFIEIIYKCYEENIDTVNIKTYWIGDKEINTTRVKKKQSYN